MALLLGRAHLPAVGASVFLPPRLGPRLGERPLHDAAVGARSGSQRSNQSRDAKSSLLHAARRPANGAETEPFVRRARGAEPDDANGHQSLAIARIASHSLAVTGVTESRPMRTSAMSASALFALISVSVTGRASGATALMSTAYQLGVARIGLGVEGGCLRSVAVGSE